MALAGCGSQSADSPRSGADEPSDPKLLKDCSGWFGADVAAALCASRATEALHVQIGGRSDPTGSSVGLAQAMGPPLSSGAKLEITGNVSRGSILLVRLDVGSTEHLGTARFTLPHLPDGGVGTLTVSGPPESLGAVLDFDSRSVTAERVSIPTSSE